MDEIIAKKPKAAALGGLPGFENKARAFVDALFRTEDKQGYTELRSKFSVEVCRWRCQPAALLIPAGQRRVSVRAGLLPPPCGALRRRG